MVAILKVIRILIKALIQSLFKHEYKLSFVKENGKWYADIKGWPQQLHDNAQMVSNSDKVLDYLAKGHSRVNVKIYPCSLNSKKNIKLLNKIKGATLTLTKEASKWNAGAIYDTSNVPKEISEIWICPVTLFVLGKYPKRIYIKQIS